MIHTENLSKTYAGKVPTPALRGVSLKVDAGEFVAIMGRSGSGKSTLLHQLGLLDEPSGGRLLIDGVDVLRLSDARKTAFRLQHLGYVFQEFALIGELTALENVCLPAFALKGSHRQHHARAAHLLEIVGLGNRLHHYPHELSGGEQQRVAIARSLINRPKILLADEPTANLDTASAGAVLEMLRTLNVDFGQTLVMVTHEPEDQRYVRRTVWLRDGVIEKIESGHAAA